MDDNGLSDHSPLWIRKNSLECGPNPFRTLSYWHEDKDISSFVKQDWDSFVVVGCKDYVLKENLKLLKTRLKW